MPTLSRRVGKWIALYLGVSLAPAHAASRCAVSLIGAPILAEQIAAARKRLEAEDLTAAYALGAKVFLDEGRGGPAQPWLTMVSGHIWQGRSLDGRIFIFKHSGEEAIAREYRILAALAEFGPVVPEAHLVRVDGRIYLATEQLPGINIRELMALRGRTEETRVAIEEMLGQRFESRAAASAAFARRLLQHPAFVPAVTVLGDRIRALGLVPIDFQFMVSLSGPTNQLGLRLIDPQCFSFSTPEDLVRWGTPSFVMDYVKSLASHAE